jgi:hypothetical protein
MSLIALVQVDMMVDGERKSFPPGETLPELHPHDVVQLKAMGAVEDTAETAAEAKKATAAEKAAGKDFAEAKANVLAAEASVEIVTDPGGKEIDTAGQGKKAKAEK